MPEETATGQDPQPQPTDQGQGQVEETAAAASDGFWDFFPDVPEELRDQLGPHLKNVQSHVTQMDQSLAAIKPLLDRGANPDEIQALVSFEAAFNNDPIGTWLRMAESMQNNPENPLLEDLDLDSLKAIANGEVVDEGTGEGGEVPEGGEGGDVDPEVAALKQQVAEMQRREAEREESSRQRVEDRLLQQAIGDMQSQLSEAGYPEQEEPALVAQIIAHNGDVNKAVETMKAQREAILKGFTESRTNKDGKEPTMPKGAPEAPERKPKRARDPFRDARPGAMQTMKSNREAAAQG